MGYSYARTTHEPTVRQLAETLWREHYNAGQEVEVATLVSDD